MSTFVDIRTALIKPIVDNSEFDIDFNYENRTYCPVSNNPYGRAYVLPVQPFQTALGNDGCDRHDGVFQISLFYPENDGDVPILTKADAIASVYKSGVVLSYNSIDVTIESIGRTEARNDNGWFQLDLTINWYSFIKRT